jgi:hypothetical protein
MYRAPSIQAKVIVTERQGIVSCCARTGLGCPDPTPAHVTGLIKSVWPFESALRFLEETTAPLTDVERGCGFLQLMAASPLWKTVSLSGKIRRG